MLNEIHNDLLEIYCNRHIGSISHQCITNESDRGAKVRSITFETTGELFNILNSFICCKQSLFFLDGEQRNLMSHNCDGIIIVEYNNQKYIIFLEIKSSYRTQDISKAQYQIMSSYYCLLTELEGLKHFDLGEYKMCCMVASHPLSEEKKLMLYKQKMSVGVSKDVELALFFAFHPDSKCDISRDDMDLLKDKPFKETHMFSTIPMFHLSVNNEEDSGLFNIDKYLSQL